MRGIPQHRGSAHALTYCIAGNIGGELYLADWRILVTPPILNPPIMILLCQPHRLRCDDCTETAKFISAKCNFLPFSSNPANISGYMIFVANPIVKRFCGHLEMWAHIALMCVHMASHLDSSDNRTVRLNHSLNNKIIFVVTPGYRVYCDVCSFAVFAHKCTSCTCIIIPQTQHMTHRFFTYQFLSNQLHHQLPTT